MRQPERERDEIEEEGEVGRMSVCEGDEEDGWGVIAPRTRTRGEAVVNKMTLLLILSRHVENPIMVMSAAGPAVSERGRADREHAGLWIPLERLT